MKTLHDSISSAGGSSVAPAIRDQDGTLDEAKPKQPLDEFVTKALEMGELLLGYTTEVGIAVDDKVRDGVLKARAEREAANFTQQTVSNLLVAVTTLAADVRPETVDRLKSPIRLKKSKRIRWGPWQR